VLAILQWFVEITYLNLVVCCIAVGVLTPGVTPTSEFVCVLSFLYGYARMTQGFILVWAKEGPMSSGGECILSCT